MKTVFVTGGFTGKGAASVVKFINEGWNVNFMDINVPAAESLEKAMIVSDPLLFIKGNTLPDIADEELDLMIETNIYGTVNTLREAVPHTFQY